jgi:hypothetical protein
MIVMNSETARHDKTVLQLFQLEQLQQGIAISAIESFGVKSRCRNPKSRMSVADLGTGDEQAAPNKVNLLPAQRAQFRRSQPMLERQQDNRGVPVATSVIARPLHQALDLALGEAFAVRQWALGIRRYTRLTNAFGKKLAQHAS